MRQILILLFIILFSVPAFADKASVTALNLLNKNESYVSDSNILSFLHQLVGDTITFNISAVNDLNMFSIEQPDTIWIKARPKKNPKEGKHYILSHTYKGVQTTSRDFRTPTSVINGKPFGVLSVDNVKSNGYYSINKDILIKLIDLDDLSIVNCLIPHNNEFSFTISSNKIDRDIKSITGNEFYLKTGNGYSTPKYTLGTLERGEQSILFDCHIGNMSVRSEVNLYFRDKDGTIIPFKYEKPYSDYLADEIIVSRAEHEDKHSLRTINSDVDLSLADSDSVLPFSFKYILGTRNGYSAYISQRIVPDNIKNYSWTSDYKTAPADELMFVGGALNVRGTKFLKMIYQGKAFFMKADDVNLSKEGKAKLDSLENCSKEVQELFWHKTLLLNQALYFKRLDDALKEVESYSKYGLAIKSWGVYDESEYTDGTSIRITFLNPTKQIIKYISISFQGYNAVDDPYGRPVSKKCVGPIDPKETASYNFEYVWFSDIVEYAKIRSITVTYKNGTTKTISNPSAIMLSDKVVETIFIASPVENFN